MRKGDDYLRSLNDGRRVFVDGELVKDVSRASGFPPGRAFDRHAFMTSPPSRTCASA